MGSQYGLTRCQKSSHTLNFQLLRYAVDKWKIQLDVAEGRFGEKGYASTSGCIGLHHALAHCQKYSLTVDSQILQYAVDICSHQLDAERYVC